MVRLIFDFNESAISERGFTKDYLLENVRSFASKYDIKETSIGVFEKDGEHAMCILTKIVYSILWKNINYNYLDFLSGLTMDINGHIEDCISIIHKCIEKDIIKIPV